ncbi:MAG: MarR family winged helix-turn-helix transcriptional regulator [Parasphingorhabdus sp.]|uniref:MarR family winged helix-turn-helix transcriptional regulator n=1 Tax=Parasphingorhabdus sp. TaxID=2709688 RepID=UPI0032999FCE
MRKPEEDLLSGIRVLLRIFTIDETRFPPAEGRIKYNAIDFQALYFIAENNDCSGAALAAFLGVPATTAQSVIERLISRGYVSRRSGTGRAIALSLSKEGQTICAAIRRQDIANCGTMLAALPEDERSDFAAKICVIARALESAETE